MPRRPPPPSTPRYLIRVVSQQPGGPYAWVILDTKKGREVETSVELFRRMDLAFAAAGPALEVWRGKG